MCFKELSVNYDGEVDTVHVATRLAKRLSRMERGDDFDKLDPNHTIETKVTLTNSERSMTLNDIYVDRLKKQSRIIRAYVKTKIQPEKKGM
mmetsp:Transcript_18752/g.28104  ORF Transcript_18752/g.28104 Transcript_18752/m.28104 type:complete len:91 (-) Transcript_18752:806-1078(-)